MTLYRIADDRFASDLSGTGSLFAPGRWHRLNTRVLYLTPTVSLAMIEVLVHTPRRPTNRALVTVTLPDKASILTVDSQTLPVGWNGFPYIDSLSDLTEQWIKEGQYWMMRVPSAPSPIEFNYLLNPLHPEHATLQLVSVEPYTFDSRLK